MIMINLPQSLLVCFLLFFWMCSVSQADDLPAISSHVIAPFAEQIVMDDSDTSEIVITNLDLLETSTLNAEVARVTKTRTQHWSPDQPPFQAEVQAAANATALEPALIHAVIATESGYNPKALSRKGAYGLMQVLPATAQSMTTVPVRQWSVPQQILWGSHYLKRMLDIFEGDVTLALAAYNAGPAAVKAHQYTIPPFAETRQYVPRVLRYYQTFKARNPQFNH